MTVGHVFGGLCGLAVFLLALLCWAWYCADETELDD